MPLQTYPLMAGTALTIDIQLQSGDQIITKYDASTPLIAAIWPGGKRAQSFSITPTWTDPTRGMISLAMKSNQTLGLEAGRYRGELQVVDPDQGPVVGYEWFVDMEDAPGNEIEPPSYCSFDNLTTYARSWLPSLQSDDDETGFAEQRGRARGWLDDLILSRYRVRGYDLTGFRGYVGGFWPGVSSPNLWLRQRLDDGGLILRSWVTEATANKTLSYICKGRNYSAPAGPSP